MMHTIPTVLHASLSFLELQHSVSLFVMMMLNMKCFVVHDPSSPSSLIPIRSRCDQLRVGRYVHLISGVHRRVDKSPQK
jgi:hypothetical protein